MAGLSRRAFLFAMSLFAPVARGRAAAAQRSVTPSTAPAAISVDEFLGLSRRLTGQTALDARIGAAYLNALAAVPANVPLLAQLARSNAPVSPSIPAQVALERAIIEAWYTGVYTFNGEARVATHTGALMWKALGMPAPASCVAPFGAWSQPPRRTN